MLLRNLSKFIQLQSFPKSRFSKINSNSDITPPNNLDMASFEFLLERGICVYQGITILINLSYQNMVMHKWLQLISSKEDVQSNHVLEAIHTSTHDDSSSTASETSDKITGKTGNEMR
jgi:hypothetical protein